MIQAITYIRVRYGETDKMGYVYYGNYAEYFEVARVELFRSIGLSYKELEENGIMMPVTKLECFYFHPARYDDRLKIVTQIPQIPDGVRITFTYKIYNDDELFLHQGETELVFIDKLKNRPCRVPEILYNKLMKWENSLENGLV